MGRLGYADWVPDWTPEVEVDAERVARWVGLRVPHLARATPRLVGVGWDNAVYRVGPELVFRFPRRQIAAELLRTEVAVLPGLARCVPVAVPEPVVVAEPVDDYPFAFAGYRWLEGETADRVDPDDAARRALAAPLGRALRALHDARPGPTADAADPGDTLDRADSARRLPGLLAHLDALAGEVDPAPIAAALTALAEVPRRAGPARWVHGDLYPRHLLLDRAGALIGLIDWGDTHRGDPALDLSIAWTFFDAAGRTALRDAYGPVDPATWDRARFRALHYGIHLLRYGLAERDAAMERVARRALTAATTSP